VEPALVVSHLLQHFVQAAPQELERAADGAAVRSNPGLLNPRAAAAMSTNNHILTCVRWLLCSLGICLFV